MKNRVKYFLIFGIGILLIGSIGMSYALFTTNTERKGALNIIAGNTYCPIVSEELDDNNQITIEQGQEKEVTIELSNQSKINVHSLITYSGDGVEVSYFTDSKDNLDIDTLPVSETRTIKLYIKNTSETNQTVTINVHCGISSKTLEPGVNEKNIETEYIPCMPPQYHDESRANAPQLAQGMIPVVYNECENSWIVQDLDKSYDYSTQHWANAVTIDSTYRDQYENADPGTKIDESHINTMWVWIPRYEYDTKEIENYAGGSQATPGEIKVKFLSGTSTESGGNYKLHPAFKFGEKELEGFWYGKFETSPETSCNSTTQCNVDTIKPQIKPNVASWVYIQIATAFTVSQKMVNEFKDEYGFSGTEDTHISKNSEWGAVAYLSQSSYGKYGNENYQGAEKEVYINNCSKYTTGIAGDTPNASKDSVCANTYEKEAGQKASTTGNITGVYDMSGGASEHVMGVLADDDGQPISGYSSSSNSGFNGKVCSGYSSCSDYSSGIEFPDEKYYDLYTSSNLGSTSSDLAKTACDEGICYGHALSETSGWYSDSYTFVSAMASWLPRGGSFDAASGAGLFRFNVNYGAASGSSSFHLVLVP